MRDLLSGRTRLHLRAVLGQDSQLRRLHSPHERPPTRVCQGSRDNMPVVRKVLSEFIERHSSLEVARRKRDTRVHPLQEEIWNER